MQRISWADPTLSGGLFEKIVGCLLGIEHPESVRVRPGQGDQGVDIFVPVGVDEVDVYQVKHYPTDLHWPKIRGSLERLREGVWLGRRVRHWRLTVPKQPTTNNLTKLDEVAAQVWEAPPFKIKWFGEDRLAALAAGHPEVGDYYLGDGRAQLQQIIRDWGSFQERMQEGHSPRVEDVQAQLARIAEALGRSDPHFKYGLDVHPAGHSGPVMRPGVVAVSSCIVGSQEISCTTYLRYRGAEEDAEDRLQIQLVLTQEAGERLAETLAVGGDPLDLSPTDIVSYRIPTLGHQALDDAPISARVSPHVDSTPAVIRVGLTAASCSRVVERFTRHSIVAGNEGATSRWLSPNGCFTLTFVSRNTGRVNLSLERTFEPQGAISAVSGDINLMRAFRAGTKMELFAATGPLSSPFASVELDETFAAVRDPAVWLLDALRVIQDHTHTIVTIPPEFTWGHLKDVVDLAALLEGFATTGDLTSARITAPMLRSALSPGHAHDVFSDQFCIGCVGSAGKEIKLPHQIIELPEELIFARVIRSCRVASIIDDDPDAEVVLARLEPGVVPILIDQRLDNAEQFDEARHEQLLEHDSLTSTAELGAELSRRGSQPTSV